MARVPNAVEILPEIWTAWVGRTNVTDRQTDRRQTDGRQHIANVNVSSRSLKTIGKHRELVEKPSCKCTSEGLMHVAVWYHGTPW